MVAMMMAEVPEGTGHNQRMAADSVHPVNPHVQSNLEC